MAREILQHHTEAVWYMPDIDGNRSDPDPFCVLISPLSGAELKLTEQSIMGARVDAGQAPNFMARAVRVRETLLAKHVLEVKGYRVAELSTGKMLEPKDGASLLNAVKATYASEQVVLDDIEEALKNASRLEAGLLGKSISPSGS